MQKIKVHAALAPVKAVMVFVVWETFTLPTETSVRSRLGTTRANRNNTLVTLFYWFVLTHP